jgi:dTDP-4-dehydrorhamnose reductase
MKILITGAKGQLGNSLVETFTDHELFLVDLPEVDLTVYRTTLEYFREVQPDWVIHCAAKTQVDQCELKPDEAYLSNVIATKNAVNACQAVKAGLVYLSTDYVFDGRGNQPYLEYDPCNPLNVYGKTKWQGEEIVKMHLSRFYIIRTAWLFGDVGSNFVRTILKLATEKDVLQVVDDQIGSPTYSRDLATAILHLIPTGAFGIYHVTNEGSCSWFDFTKQILKEAGIIGIKVESITSDKMNRPAQRPSYSVLAKNGLNSLGLTMPTYQDALQRFFQKNRP